MRKRLSISWYDELIFVLVWTDGKLELESGDASLQDSVDRWSTGLNEWMLDPDSGLYENPRTTSIESELFLPRLSAYLERQFPGTYLLEEEKI